ncbi:hypothetical protein E2C01_033795 [Portunus trituberculatus]|uniref:Uncharacterized protein n=1 Tax=Portunus trituberculatus TaxID=210409 RepID=A0A5B7F4Q7_PORTR|nr:hypothetical protein [Portunus trituberculatus]
MLSSLRVHVCGLGLVTDILASQRTKYYTWRRDPDGRVTASESQWRHSIHAGIARHAPDSSQLGVVEFGSENLASFLLISRGN